MMLLASAVISVATQQYDDALSITVVSNIYGWYGMPFSIQIVVWFYRSSI